MCASEMTCINIENSRWRPTIGEASPAIPRVCVDAFAFADRSISLNWFFFAFNGDLAAIFEFKQRRDKPLRTF